MNVLQINKLYYPLIGGIETIVRQTAEGINQSGGFTVDVLACNDTFTTAHESVNGVSVVRASSLGRVLSMPVSLRFISLLNGMWRRYDLLHVHLPFPLGELALWMIRPQVKFVVTYHSDIVRQRLLSSALGWLHAWTLGHAAAIAVSSPNIAATSRVLKPFKEKCTVIPFGADTERFNPESGDPGSIQRIHATYGKRIILFVGRLVYYKGVEYLIQAMQGVDARLLIIGEGPLRQSLEREAVMYNVQNAVTFLPSLTQDELVNFYRASSVFVLPSVYRSEAFGIAIIEAMACGLPVISTDLGTGTSFANQDGVTGYVVPPRDSGAINRALKKLLSDSTLCSGMGHAAARRIREGFTLERMLIEYKNLYTRILS